MVEQNTVLALKNLCAKMKGGKVTASDIPGNTIPDVIAEITKVYAAPTPQQLGTLTVKSVAGTVIGNTKITVTGASSSAKFRYKSQSGAISLPAFGDDLTTWTVWDGASELKISDGHHICVCEVDGNNKAQKGGTATVSSKLS